MKSFKRKLLIPFILILCLSTVFNHALAQDKVEREESIKEADVPAKAKEWLYDAFENIKKPKWYKEFSEIGISYEAKFKYRSCFHSVEFDSLGTVQDVEVELELEGIAEGVRSSINKYFAESFKDYKIIKIQIQFSGDPDDLEDFFDEEEREGILVQYEIEFSATDFSGDTEIWEGTFDELGQFLNKRKIVVREMDNIIF